MLSAFLRCVGPLGCLGQSAEPSRIIDGDVRQHLAVKLHPGFLQAADELVVADAVLLCSSANTHNPDGTKLTLLLAAAGIGKLEAALHRFFGGPIELGFCEKVPAGAFQNFLAALAALGTTFD